MREAELILVSVSRKWQQARLISTVTLVQLRLGRGHGRRQEAAFGRLMSSLVFERWRLLVPGLRRPLAGVVRPGDELRRKGAPFGEQELDVPGRLAVVVQELL